MCHFFATICLETKPSSFREYAQPKIVCLAPCLWNVRLFQFVTVIQRCWIWSTGRSISFDTLRSTSMKHHQCDCICALSNVCLRAMLKNVWVILPLLSKCLLVSVCDCWNGAFILCAYWLPMSIFHQSFRSFTVLRSVSLRMSFAVYWLAFEAIVFRSLFGYKLWVVLQIVHVKIFVATCLSFLDLHRFFVFLLLVSISLRGYKLWLVL